MKQLFEDRRIFIAAMMVALAPTIYVVYGSRATPLFAVGLLAWSFLPLAIPFLMFYLRRQHAAWGWLAAVLVHNYFVIVSVRLSESSTGSLDYITAPFLSIVVIGPLGALVGVLLARAIRRLRPSN